MIHRYTFGAPVQTGAVVTDIAPTTAEFPLGTVQSAWPFSWNFPLEKDAIVFGLGEAVRGMNKRGFTFVSWCSDVPNQDEFTPSMYGAHNFLIVFSATCTVGLFFDTASRITFDIGCTDPDLLTVHTKDTGVDVYIISAETAFRAGQPQESALTNIVRQFRALVGQSYIPPRWAFGLQQSRWGYKTEADVRAVVQGYRQAGMPLDAVCLDIDYMVDYEDFTIDTAKFPDMAALCAELKAQGIHLVPIIDAGVKQLPGYSVYEEGMRNKYFCPKSDGTEYTAGVWPGRAHFPDFFRPEVREWFGAKYRMLTELGLDGFWNDMNEPAMFYSEESLAEAFAKLDSFKGKNLDIQTFFEFTPVSGSTFNRLDDYQRFYHSVTMPDGSRQNVRHDKVHNLYGGLMTRAAAEALQSIAPEKRMLLYSRASCIGAHRYGGIWTGDNASCWAHLLQEIKMMPALNMAGFLYSGADIGGFGQSATRDLVLRWLAFGCFTPLMRNHSAWNTRNQECYAFGDTAEFKSILDLRYALIPYLYSEFVKAALTGGMYMRPLAFDWPNDSRAVRVEDELLVGEGLLVAPVHEQNAEGRYVYLPEDMLQVTWQDSHAECVPVERGDHYVPVPLDAVVFFVRQGHLLPLAKPAACTEQLNSAEFTLIGTGTGYDLYEDDGYTRNVTLNGRLRHLAR